MNFNNLMYLILTAIAPMKLASADESLVIERSIFMIETSYQVKCTPNDGVAYGQWYFPDRYYNVYKAECVGNENLKLRVTIRTRGHYNKKNEFVEKLKRINVVIE